MSSQNIIVLEKVESTNNYAMGLIQKGAVSSGTGVFTHEQTAGKGRRGKSWVTIPGQNILLSIAVEMKWQPVLEQFPLSVGVALACRDFISEKVESKVCIKWPNDIYITDSKAAGILIENVIKGTLWQWSVIGIGVNVNQESFEGIDAEVTSLKKESGKEYDILESAGELQEIVLGRIEDLKAGRFTQMLEEYNKHLYGRGRLVKLKKDTVVFETTIQSVSSSGQLITKDAMERQFNFDEVEFRGIII